MKSTRPILALLISLSAGCILLAGCQRRARERVSPLSPTPPKVELLRSPAKPVANLPPVPSEGNCAPRYKNGLVGSCINNQPCRGFGVRDATGKAVCSCYGRLGGCETGMRCDAIKKVCVPENEPGFGRAQED